jgi:glycosyltransferase involved in cell wall biosynthesis
MISVPVLNGEAFGMYLLESMASGVPVVQPSLGAFPEIIEKAGGGITYTPNSPNALADALISLLQNPEKLRQLSKNGRHGIEEGFNVHHEVENLVNRYSKIMAEKK